MYTISIELKNKILKNYGTQLHNGEDYPNDCSTRIWRNRVKVEPLNRPSI